MSLRFFSLLALVTVVSCFTNNLLTSTIGNNVDSSNRKAGAESSTVTAVRKGSSKYSTIYVGPKKSFIGNNSYQANQNRKNVAGKPRYPSSLGSASAADETSAHQDLMSGILLAPRVSSTVPTGSQTTPPPMAHIRTRAPPIIASDPGQTGNKQWSAQTPSSMTNVNLELKNRQDGMSHLLNYLFSDYNKEAAPSTPVQVDLKVLLIKVKNTIEREGIFECVVALFIAWHDPRLQWDPYNYDNITTLAFEPERLWLPDIAMTNSADHVYSISRDTRFVVRVSHDGRSVFVPSGTSRTWCDLKLVTFPFDQQTCSLDFESWTLDNSSLVFDRTSNVLVDDTNSNYYSTQWRLCYFRTTIRNVTYSDSMGGTFQRISFTLNIHRKSSFYLVNLIFPIAMLSVIQLCIFFIPGIDSASSRIGFGTTNLLTLVVFQTIVTEELPKTSDAVTALSQYIIALIIFSAFGIFESVVIECILRMEDQTAPPWVRKVVEFTTQRHRLKQKQLKQLQAERKLKKPKLTAKVPVNNQIKHDVMMDVDLNNFALKTANGNRRKLSTPKCHHEAVDLEVNKSATPLRAANGRREDDDFYDDDDDECADVFNEGDEDDVELPFSMSPSTPSTPPTSPPCFFYQTPQRKLSTGGLKPSKSSATLYDNYRQQASKSPFTRPPSPSGMLEQALEAGNYRIQQQSASTNHKRSPPLRLKTALVGCCRDVENVCKRILSPAPTPTPTRDHRPFSTNKNKFRDIQSPPLPVNTAPSLPSNNNTDADHFYRPRPSIASQLHFQGRNRRKQKRLERMQRASDAFLVEQQPPLSRCSFCSFHQQQQPQNPSLLHQAAGFHYHHHHEPPCYCAHCIKSGSNIIGSQPPNVRPTTMTSMRSTTPLIAAGNVYSNYTYWADFATILDYVSFMLCTFLAVFIPVALFIPLVNSTDDHSCIN